MGGENPAGLLYWKFVAIEGRGGQIWWRWEVWTQAGELANRSPLLYETLTECEHAAEIAGYVRPEKRTR